MGIRTALKVRNSNKTSFQRGGKSVRQRTTEGMWPLAGARRTRAKARARAAARAKARARAAGREDIFEFLEASKNPYWQGQYLREKSSY